VPTLSNRDNEILFRRGVTARNDHHGVHITLTPVGIVWLFNYLYSSRNLGVTLSLALLKDLAKFQPEKGSWRALRLKAVPIPVYEGTEYFQLVFYLDGTPPRAFHAFPPSISAISSTFSVPLMDGGAFNVRNDQIVNIEFSDSEVEQLENGKLVIIQGNV